LKFSLLALVDLYMKDLNKELDVVLGYMNVELEGRFSYVRTQETNLGNFVADILLASVINNLNLFILILKLMVKTIFKGSC
jgi:2',3'-cyclic-nucleotide 2'-phosphodiesterase (5'-nucleotidase family)